MYLTRRASGRSGRGCGRNRENGRLNEDVKKLWKKVK